MNWLILMMRDFGVTKNKSNGLILYVESVLGGLLLAWARLILLYPANIVIWQLLCIEEKFSGGNLFYNMFKIKHEVEMETKPTECEAYGT